MVQGQCRWPMRIWFSSVSLWRYVALNAGEEVVPFSLVAAGTKCSNFPKDLSFSATSAQQCADLVCADPQCGPFFEDRSHTKEGQRCSCLEEAQVCQEVADPGTNRYQITDMRLCRSKASADCFATLYENSGFSGWDATFPNGAFTSDDLEEGGAVKGAISAIYVSPDCVATLYQNGDFSGWAVTFSEGSYTADDIVAMNGRDNEASALKVRHSDAPEPVHTPNRQQHEPPAASAPQGKFGAAREYSPPAPPGVPPAPPRAKSPSAESAGFSPPPPRCAFSVAKELKNWTCDLVSKKDCSKEELDYLASAEAKYRLPHDPIEGAAAAAWKGDLEKLEEDALVMYFMRKDIPRDRREWTLKQLTILRHLCDRGAGQPWGLDKPRKPRREEL